MERLLKELLTRNEGDLLDFKTTFYDIHSRDSRTDFVKDVLAMANSSQQGEAYIICGVKIFPDGNKQIDGVPENLYVDDAPWHQMILKYASHPVNFSVDKYRSSEFNKCFVIVKISVNQKRPIVCIFDEGEKLKRGNIYFRNGSSNEVATSLVTIEKMIEVEQETHISSDPTYNRYSKFPPAPYYRFYGRKTEIEAIYSKLINHHKNYVLSLLGPGGVGKTSIAYKIAL